MSKIGRNLTILVLLLLTLLLAACGSTTVSTTATSSTPANTAANATSGTSSGKIKVVATTTQIGDMVKNVGGNRIDLVTILKPDVDAHEYEPTADDSKALAAAQVIFSNGVGLEEWLEKTIKNSGTKGQQFVVSDGIKVRPGHGEEDKAGDPHIWFSTENAKLMVNNIAAGLSKADPAGKATYEANAKAYNGQIDEVTNQIKGLIDTIPASNRKLVTNHDAFGYFADQFGLKVVGSVIPSSDSTAEPNAKDLAELVQKIKAEKVPAIFTESSINPKLQEQISKEAGVKIYSNLYADSLSAPGSDADTYLKMMLANARNIAAGLK